MEDVIIDNIAKRGGRAVIISALALCLMLSQAHIGYSFWSVIGIAAAMGLMTFSGITRFAAGVGVAFLLLLALVPPNVAASVFAALQRG